jgi:hypothetical protein
LYNFFSLALITDDRRRTTIRPHCAFQTIATLNAARARASEQQIANVS